MSKFNTSKVQTARGVGPLKSETIPSGRTALGGAGYVRDPKSELFLLGVANFASEGSAHENAVARDDRFTDLVRQVAKADLPWLIGFAGWLRNSAQMRSASVVLAAEAVRACVDAEIPGSRRVMHAALARADEPGELLAYWFARHGRQLPKPLKRGLSDAARRLYTERTAIKYDSPSHGVRFGDLVQLVHPNPKAPWQERLYRAVMDDRYGKPMDMSGLPMLAANKTLREVASADVMRMARNGSLSNRLQEAGFTWEALPSLINGPLTRELWESMIPSMGLTALIRNLRNFDQTGVSDTVAATIAAKLADPEQITAARLFPMQILAAYRAAPHLRWAYPLERALDSSLLSVPEMNGRTLILVDTSGSMADTFSKDGSLMRWDAATIFGLALARRCQNADVISYSQSMRKFDLVPGESLLRALDRWMRQGYFLNEGTNTIGAVRASYQRHDRVVILTDEQYGGFGWSSRTHGFDAIIRDVGNALPQNIPLYTWNLAGYQMGHAPEARNRYTFGGLTDRCFQLIGLLDRGSNADWPWLAT